jgi:hypothetical protein
LDVSIFGSFFGVQMVQAVQAPKQVAHRERGHALRLVAAVLHSHLAALDGAAALTHATPAD